jgi:hypothetical protein
MLANRVFYRGGGARPRAVGPRLAGACRDLERDTRGVLWAAGKLGDDGRPVAGYGPQGK